MSGWGDRLSDSAAAAGGTGSVWTQLGASPVSAFLSLSLPFLSCWLLIFPFSISMGNLAIFIFRYSSLKSYQHTEAFVLDLSQAECLWWGSVVLACGGQNSGVHYDATWIWCRVLLGRQMVPHKLPHIKSKANGWFSIVSYVRYTKTLTSGTPSLAGSNPCYLLGAGKESALCCC